MVEDNLTNKKKVLMVQGLHDEGKKLLLERDDIEAITINRWSHGYAYEYNSLYDPEWEEGQAPHELGRAPIGRISIANSDSEADAYLHSAIDAAARAVSEIKQA